MVTEAESNKLPLILLVEDSEDDRFFFQRALSRSKQPHQLVSVSDGHEALRYLESKRAGSTENEARKPDIIFLDLKLPKFSGFEVLKWMRERAILQKICVIVLSGSDQQKDRDLARELGARDYVVKPVPPEYLQASLKEVSGA